MASNSIFIEGFIEPALEKTYLHLPFNMPVEAIRLDVTFQYTDRIGSSPMLTGGNTIDLGLFDQRGTHFLNAGFRGWSGSERDDIFISPHEATPGYMAGPLLPGEWYVMLGLYKLGTNGCEYRVGITITTGDAGFEGVVESIHAKDLPASQPPAPYAPWLRGELHCHTWHSDGKLSLPELLTRARLRGLDFIAVTDHNTISAQRELSSLLEPGLVLIRGVESTTFKGHFNVWGIPDWIDFRVHSPEEMADVIQYANQLGAVTSINHPKPYGPDWEYNEVTDAHCIEVWNGPWSGLNEIALEYWLSLLNKGQRKPAVGGSDFHRASENGGRDLGTPTNWVFVSGEATSQNILSAIRQGHVCVSATPDGPLLDLRGGKDGSYLAGDILYHSPDEQKDFQVRSLGAAGCVLRLLDQGHVLLEQQIVGVDEKVEYHTSIPESRFVRAELRSIDGLMLALSNPIYLEIL